MRIFSPLTWLAFLLVAVPRVSSATVVLEQSLEEMTTAAPLIVEGTIQNTQAKWNQDAGRIFTYSTLRVTRNLKGKAPPTLQLRQPGGIVGNVGQKVSGAAQFVVGEKVLLFLEPSSDEAGVFLVWAMSAGKLSLVEGSMGETLAVRDLKGLHFYRPQTDQATLLRTLHSSSNVGTLNSLRNRIQTQLKKRTGDSK